MNRHPSARSPRPWRLCLALVLLVSGPVFTGFAAPRPGRPEIGSGPRAPGWRILRGPAPALLAQRQEQARLAERAALPWVTDIETWHERRTLALPRHDSPSLIRLRDCEWRIYWNEERAGGITSARSIDGAAEFRDEPDFRIRNGGRGSPEAVVGHPWVVPLAAGFRMYYHGDARWQTRVGEAPILRVFSAWSRNGRHFFGEGVRLDLGDRTGLDLAAHPCVRPMPDGTWRMWFTAVRARSGGRPCVHGASSADGLTWRLDPAPTVDGASDPLVFERAGRWVMFARFGADNVLLLSSPDGLAFHPQAWVEFFDARGLRLAGFVPAEVLDAADGRVRVLGTGDNSRGLGLFERHAPQWPH